MPHVASALKTHAAHRPPAARPPQGPDRAPPTPFASLVDDNAAAPEQRPAADDRGIRAARADQAPPAAKNTKNEDDVIEAAKNGKSGKSGKIDKIGPTSTNGEVAVEAEAVDGKSADAKTADAKAAKPGNGVDTTPVNAVKLAESPVAPEAHSAPPTDSLPTIATAATPFTLTTPRQVATPAKPGRVDAHAAIATATAQTENGAALTAQAAAQRPGEVKPQGLAADAADKDSIAHARGEAPHGEHASATRQATLEQTQAALTTEPTTAAPKPAAEFTAPIVHSAPPQTHASAAPNAAANAPLPQPAAIPFAGVAIEIAGKALAGKNHFEIRLDPPELGRIEVRLHVDRDGNVTSRMIADRADTLDLLRRDVAGLERALQDAGLKTSDNGLQFSLRDQWTQQQQQQQQQSARAGETAHLVLQDETLPLSEAAPRHYGRLAGLGGGVDIQV